MNYYLIQQFITEYSISTIIISVIVGVFLYVIDKKTNLKPIIKNFIPLIAGIILNYLYDSIFISKTFSVKEEVIAVGILSGYLGQAVLTCIKRSKNNRTVSDSPLILSLLSILNGYFSDAICENLANELSKIDSSDKLAENKILALLTSYYNGENYFDLQLLVKLILSAIKSINNNHDNKN